MDATRRELLIACSSGAAALLLRFGGVAAAQDQSPTLPPVSSKRRNPTDPDDPNAPPGFGSAKAVLEQRQKDMKKDVEKLYDLASQLKAEVEKTDATTILSLAMVKKAEEIEKLAKQIKDHAKG
jgi:hypothetical protein